MILFDIIKSKGLEHKLKSKTIELQMKMLESMPDFAKDPDENQWTVLGSGESKEYNDIQMATLRSQAQTIYYTSPLARGIIDILINFVIGRNFKIVPEDDIDKVNDYWDKFWEDNKMDLRVKEWVKRAWRDGETFAQLFERNEEKLPPLVRFIKPSQIVNDKHSHGIETSELDVETAINYYREYTKTDGDKVKLIIPADKMIHTKILVDSDVKRGLSFLLGIIKYIVDYTDWLNDRKHLNKIRTIFNLIGKPTGSSSTTNFLNQFEDTSIKNTSGSTGTYNKKLPKSGSLIASKGMEYDFKSLDLNAADTQHDGRAILLMIVAGSNLAEYMVTGDASNSNYASTMVSESPAVRTFEAWQDFFAFDFKDLYKRVIMNGVKNGDLPDKYEKEVETWDPVKQELKTTKEEIMITGKCKIEYPVLIHRDIEKDTKAFALQETSGYTSKKTVSTKLGYDYEGEQKQIIRERQEEMLLDMEDEHNHEPEEE